MRQLSTILSAFHFSSLISQVVSAKAILSISTNEAVLSNPYVKVKFNFIGGFWVSGLWGDFRGVYNYGPINLLSTKGIRLERENEDGSISSSCDLGPRPNVTMTETSNCASVSVDNVVDDIEKPTVSESWTFSLCQNERTLKFSTRGFVNEGFENFRARSVRHSVYANPLSTTGFFDDGVVQMMGAMPLLSHFGSVNRLQRLYFMGETGTIDIMRSNIVNKLNNAEDPVVLLNGNSDNVDYKSGFHEILVGSFLNRDVWCKGSSESDTQELGSAAWARTWHISPNNRNFPSATLPTATTTMDGADDLEAFMTGVYGSAVPCLCTYPGEVSKGVQVAQIATSLRYNAGRGYNGTYNYFDPDNFFTISAILYSGDPYLQTQARNVITRTGDFMKGDTGHLPHHFVGTEPYYLALSGETQTGPNTFWVKTALRYAAVTGDIEWLREYLPTLRKAAQFVFGLIDPEVNLVFAPGSLMIDVFIRNNYTADSNAMVVGFIRDFAEAERLVGSADRAAELEATALRVIEAVNNKLWAAPEAGSDHYITQLNKDGSTRDFVDYDANLIAIANGVSDEVRSRAIQSRIDGGRCSAAGGAGPQFVSEVYYGREDTTNSNVGDSWCSMARIGWFDARGRKRFGTAEDLLYFNTRLLAPVQNDLIANTWMHERYGCDGLQQQNRTMYYFEYPSYVSMLLREIRYGIDLSLSAITVEPFGAPSVQGTDKIASDNSSYASFEYHIGNVDVVFSAKQAVISVPGVGLFEYRVGGLIPNRRYSISAGEECSLGIHSGSKWANILVQASADGRIVFQAPRGSSPCAVTVDLFGQ